MPQRYQDDATTQARKAVFTITLPAMGAAESNYASRDVQDIGNPGARWSTTPSATPQSALQGARRKMIEPAGLTE